jgi:flagella basal body P-ring formation protein FlgA
MPLLICLLLLSAVATSYRQVGGIRIPPEVTVSHDQLTLGDLADIKTATPAEREKLGLLSLGYAPGVGAVRELTRERIILAISAAGFAIGQINVDVPPVVRIRRSSQTVDPHSIHEAIEHAVLGPLQASGATARLSRLELPSVIEVPSGVIEIRATSNDVTNLFSPFIASIELRVDGRVVRRLSATAQIEAFAPVLVADHDLAAHSRVRPDDVRIDVRRLDHPINYYITDKQRLRGTGVRSAVSKNEPLTTQLLTAEIIIKPGDSVRIMGNSPGFQVAVAGEARAAGRVGDRIQVKNTGSGALLQAVVEDEGLVRVLF